MPNRLVWRRRFIFAAFAALSGWLLLPATVQAQASASLSAFPTSFNWGTIAVGTVGVSKPVAITNNGTQTVTISSVAVSAPFQLTAGSAPVSLSPGAQTHYSMDFAPTAVGTYNGSLTLTLSDNSTFAVPLSGIAKASNAAVTLSPTSLTFSNPQGTISAPQTVTVTNSGMCAIKVVTISADPPFTVSVAGSTSLQPGQSLSINVSFFATATTTFHDTLVINYTTLLANGVNLTGTGAPPGALGIDTFPTLPAGTQSAAYLATLQAAGGVGQLTWSLASGSALPTGLTLSSSGIISGTFDPSVAAGSYTFTVQVADSNLPPSTAAETFTLSVSKQTGAACNNITFDVAGTSSPLVPVTDLGTGTYLGAEQGGLYANGSNVRPAGHDASGVSLAQAIQPLDSNGNPSSTGKYVLLGLGMSDLLHEFASFLNLANPNPSKNANLVIVNGGQGGETALALTSPSSQFWTTIVNNFLPNAGVTSNQVVAAFVETVDGGPSGTFPSDMTTLQSQYETVAQLLLIKFPNIKLAYFSSRIYAGYSNGLSTTDPEPFAYESAFAVKNAIQDQINGNANLNFDPTLGPVLAPWMSWGPYYWANGLLARSDGLVWTCQDLSADGLHGSTAGYEKVAVRLLNFFVNDDTTTPWFLAPQH